MTGKAKEEKDEWKYESGRKWISKKNDKESEWIGKWKRKRINERINEWTRKWMRQKVNDWKSERGRRCLRKWMNKKVRENKWLGKKKEKEDE